MDFISILFFINICMIPFRKLFKILSECDLGGNTSSSIFGDSSEVWSAGGTDTDYAHNDNRIPKVLGSKKKKGKKKKSSKIKILRRNFK